MRRTLAALAGVLLAGTYASASFINYSSREINVKLVYYGSESAGLSENLQYVYAKTNPEAKGKMISLATETDRTLFFDFLPLSLGEIRGFKTRFHLYTVPGKVTYEASRKLILKGVDGVVFVADADPARREATIESWESLKANLAEQGYALEKTPLTIQLDTHRTQAPISADELKTLLGLGAATPVFVADPVTGVGVFDTLKSVAKQVLMELKKGASEPAPATPAVAEPPPTPRVAPPPAKPCGPYGLADGFGCQVNREKAQAAIRASKLGKHAAWIEKQLANALWISPTAAPLDQLSPGESRFGGEPDLPLGFEWPRYQKAPLTFLAQLRLADIAPHDKESRLPKTGWLTAFCETEEQDWVGAPDAKEACRLFYFDAQPSALVRHRTSHRPNRARPLPSARLRFAPGFTLADPSADIGPWPFNQTADDYIGLVEALRGQPPGQTTLHHLFGHAQLVQGDVRAECQPMKKGSKTDDWVLVLQIDSDDLPGWMWGDAGILYFLMTKADLAARKFSEACAVIDGY
jgi:uncharacterized protein YwqG/signal recognition particle receptor subunit beta